jgi:hypothetical protein
MGRIGCAAGSRAARWKTSSSVPASSPPTSANRTRARRRPTPKKLRSGPDRLPGWLLFIEAQEPDAAWSARTDVLHPAALQKLGAAAGGAFGVYRLAFALSSSSTGIR